MSIHIYFFIYLDKYLDTYIYIYVYIYIWRGTPRAYFTRLRSASFAGFFYSKEVWFTKVPFYEYGGTQALVGERNVPTGLFS